MNDKVVIMTARAGFPNGYGAASIIRKYAKGFSDNGYKVHIMLLRPSEYKDNQMNYASIGQYKNATYEYMGKQVVSPVSRLKRLFVYGYGLVRSCWYIIKNKNNIKTMFFYSPDHICSVRFLTMLCNVLKIRCVGIKTESSYCDTERLKKKNWKKIEKELYKGFDAFCVISKYLENQLRGFGYKKEIKVVPILVDTDMYPLKGEVRRKKEIIYMGSAGHDEEMNAIVNIARHIPKKHCDWKIVIIGEISQKKGILQALVETGYVECTGGLTYDKLAERLMDAGILILPRSKQEYSNAGFPIKLGEYLLTGAPVIATEVGEIKDYLKSEKELYLVEPDNINQFLEKLDFVIEHYEEALTVGDAGKQAAIRLFSANQICKMMMED